MPILLEKDTLEAIRTWSLKRMHLIQSLSNFFFSYVVGQRETCLFIERRAGRTIMKPISSTRGGRTKEIFEVTLGFLPK
jgi:hypothetical protein